VLLSQTVNLSAAPHCYATVIVTAAATVIARANSQERETARLAVQASMAEEASLFPETYRSLVAAPDEDVLRDLQVCAHIRNTY
jgi:hypothetical protein